MDNALNQGARLIFVNGTSDWSGQYFSQYCFSSDSINYSIKEALNQSIELIKSNSPFVPVIFCSTGIRLTYYIDAISLKVPLLDKEGRRLVDRNKEIVPLDCGHTN
jgi:hypothetical protein